MSTLSIIVVLAGLATAGFLLANVVISRGAAAGARRAFKTGNPPLTGKPAPRPRAQATSPSVAPPRSAS